MLAGAHCAVQPRRPCPSDGGLIEDVFCSTVAAGVHRPHDYAYRRSAVLVRSKVTTEVAPAGYVVAHLIRWEGTRSATDDRRRFSSL